MEEQVTCHEDYRKLYNDSVSWLSEAKRKLQRLDDSSGDCQSLEGRLKTLQVSPITHGTSVVPFFKLSILALGLIV